MEPTKSDSSAVRLTVQLADTDEALRFTKAVLETIRQPLLVLTGDLSVAWASAAFYHAFQVRAGETLGRRIYAFDDGEWDLPELRRLLENVLPDNNGFDDYEIEHTFPRLGRRVLRLSGRRLHDSHLILLVIEDITERARRERQQRVLAGELQHRVKNVLMNVRALFHQTLRYSRDLEHFSEVFQGRLDALARTQDLLAKAPAKEVPLHELILLELEAQGAEEERDYSIDGPELSLGAEAAQAMSLMVHELTTNAAKYGALAAERGRIEITWRIERRDGRERLLFRWREHGVRIEQVPETRGFGAQLIESSLAYMFGGSSTLTFHPDGAECVMDVPMPRV